MSICLLYTSLLLGSSTMNIVLDLWLVCGLELGIAGAAWATLAAQGVSAVLSFALFRRTLKQCTTSNPLTDSCDKSIAESPLRQNPDSEMPVHPMSDGTEHHSAPVSFTHLDVYKRQII